MKTPQRGFTMIELLIVVALIALIAGIAIPAYDSQIRRGHRAEAQQFMVEIANRETQYLLDARNYTVGSTALTDLTLTAPATVSTFYTIAVTNGAGGTTVSSPPSFKITATPIAGTKQASDGALTLTDTGAKTRAGNPGW